MKRTCSGGDGVGEAELMLCGCQADDGKKPGYEIDTCIGVHEDCMGVDVG